MSLIVFLGDAPYCTPEQYKDCAEPALGKSSHERDSRWHWCTLSILLHISLFAPVKDCDLLFPRQFSAFMLKLLQRWATPENWKLEMTLCKSQYAVFFFYYWWCTLPYSTSSLFVIGLHLKCILQALQAHDMSFNKATEVHDGKCTCHYLTFWFIRRVGFISTLPLVCEGLIKSVTNIRADSVSALEFNLMDGRSDR